VEPLLVTGATGLVGANVCRILAERGIPYRALVRPDSDAAPLSILGADVVRGDVMAFDDVARAAQNCRAIIHSAAVLGGASQDLNVQERTNVTGAWNVYEAARLTGMRVVTLGTTTYFAHDQPLAEDAVMTSVISDDPYTRTKAAAFIEGMRRVSGGQDIVFVIPGGVYGPSPAVKRALGPTSFNRLVRAALQKRVHSYMKFPVPWVRAEDVATATVEAIQQGVTGEKYLAFGAEDAISTAAFLSRACTIAGVDHTIDDIECNVEDPAQLELYGPSLIAIASRPYPKPWFRNDRTKAVLHYKPAAMETTLAETIDWFRANGMIEAR
jgi:nucleoside-diphosphate-sugar epimerase